VFDSGTVEANLTNAQIEQYRARGYDGNNNGFDALKIIASNDYNDGFEPDSLYNPTVISLDTDITGHSVGGGDESDFFKFHMPKDGMVTIHPIDMGSSPVMLYVLKDGDAGNVNSVLMSNSDYSIGVAGDSDYYIQISRSTDYEPYSFRVNATFTNNPPTATVTSNSYSSGGDIRIDYTMYDTESDYCNVTFSYSVDGGNTFKFGTLSSDSPAVNYLSASSGGENHYLIWDSVSDIVSGSVIGRIIPDDGNHSGNSVTFTVGDISNQPTETTYTISGKFTDATGKITLWKDGAIVSQADTDTSGNFSIGNLQSGNYETIAYVKNCQPVIMPLSLNQDISELNFTFVAIPTVTPTQYFIRVGGSAKVDHDHDGVAEDVVPGDYITAVDSGGQICGVYSVNTGGQYGVMYVYGDDPETRDDDGATLNDTVSFYIDGMKASETCVYDEMSAGGSSHIINLTAVAGENSEQTIKLATGWNLISFNLMPNDTRIEKVFSDVMSKVKVISTFYINPPDNGVDGARSYENDPNWLMLNDLHNVDPYHGYYVYMTDDATITLKGNSVSESHQRKLKKGWNLIGYWLKRKGKMPKSTGDVGTAIDSIFGSKKIKGELQVMSGLYNKFDTDGNGAKSFENDPNWFALNDLNDLSPNHGYWVKMKEDGVLDYSH
jgi:hypothetical protein